jgi:trimeric autotransporter adhesin
MADVWFAKDASAPSAAELLAGPAADLLGSDAGKSPAGAVSAVATMAGRGSLEDELLRNSTPLI